MLGGMGDLLAIIPECHCVEIGARMETRIDNAKDSNPEPNFGDYFPVDFRIGMCFLRLNPSKNRALLEVFRDKNAEQVILRG
jgi:hypothetical protein